MTSKPLATGQSPSNSGQDLPRVTVVVPVFNGARHIQATLAAIQSQTYRDFDCLVVDDCSTDDTVRLVEAVATSDQRFQVMSTPSNTGGPATPRNLGVAAARGEWLAFCDADDLWAPDKLRVQLETASSIEAALYCVAIQDFHDGYEPVLPIADATPAPWDTISISQMLVKNRVAMSGVLIARETLVEVGAFNTDRALIAVEDYDMWLRCLETTGRPIVRIDRALVMYRRVADSISAGKRKMVRKAMRVQAGHYERQGQSLLFTFYRPFIAVRYIVVSLWTRYIRKTL